MGSICGVIYNFWFRLILSSDAGKPLNTDADRSLDADAGRFLSPAAYFLFLFLFFFLNEAAENYDRFCENYDPSAKKLCLWTLEDVFALEIRILWTLKDVFALEIQILWTLKDVFALEIRILWTLKGVFTLEIRFLDEIE